MSSIGDGPLSFTRTPQLDVGASQAAIGTAAAPRSNSMLELAGALSDLNPKLKTLGFAVAKEDKEVQSAAARKLALQTGGKALADAVRDGQIEPTQNPYFIEDYNKESSYIRAQGEIARIREDSISWPEQGDPQAFQARYLQELSQIGSAYDTDPDTQTGFAAAAQQATQQDFAANTAQRVAAIKADRIAVTSNLVAQSVTATQMANKGKPSPSQVFEGLAPLKEQFLETGGTPGDWDKLVLNGVTAAALNQGNASLMDILKDSQSGTAGSIYNLPGNAQDIQTTKYRIIQDQQDKANQQYQDIQRNDYLQGRQATINLYNKFGTDAFTGNVPADQMVETLKAAGTPVLAIGKALSAAQASVADYQSLATARFRSFANSQDGRKELLDVAVRAQTQGWTPALEESISRLVLNNDMPYDDAARLIDQSLTTLDSRRGAEATAAKRTLKQYQGTASSMDASVTTLAGKTNLVLSKRGQARLSPEEVSQIQRTSRAVANYFLQGTPGDYKGALAEGQKAAADTIRRVLEARQNKASTTTKASK